MEKVVGLSGRLACRSSSYTTSILREEAQYSECWESCPTPSGIDRLNSAGVFQYGMHIRKHVCSIATSRPEMQDELKSVAAA